MRVKRIEFEWSEGGSVEIEDGIWRSVGGKLLLATEVDEGMDPDDATLELMGKVKSLVRDDVGAEFARLYNMRRGVAAPRKPVPPQPEEPLPFEEEDAPRAPAHKPASPPPPVAQPAGARLDDEFEVIEVKKLSIEMLPDGERRWVKARGGGYMKFGVIAWDDMMEKPPLEWDIYGMDLGEYAAPSGLTAKVLMKQHSKDPNKMVPDKVVEWL